MVEEDGSLGASPVYLFPHFEAAGAHEFVAVMTADGKEVREQILRAD